MNINIDNIKEISLVSYKSNGNKIEYKDLLRISHKWYSYTRTDLNNNKDINYWSYKSNLEYIYKKFNNLCDLVVYEFNNPHQEFTGESEYKFNLRINLYDGTHLDICRIGRFIDNDMSDVAILLLRCIPELESYPDVIGLFKSRYLTKERLKSINKNNLCGYMYAEDGAMGDPGCISLITTDLTRYYVDRHCGRWTDIHYCELNYLLDSFEYRSSYHKETLELLTIKDFNWIHLNLGAGNHLFLRSDMFDYIGNMILDNDRVRMYGKWRHLIEPCGDDNTCAVIEVDGDALENECDILCHQVNLDGVMGGGIALSIAKRYPLVKKEYQEYPNKKLGEVCFVKTDDYVVANCFSQRKSFVTDYDALRDCLDKVVNYMKCNHKTSVAIPYKYGCGIANGDWDRVRSIFEEKLKGYTLVIYKLKSKTTDSKESSKPVNKNPLVMLYEALSCLHKKGYENIRIMSYFSPSGLYLRCVITLKDYFNYTGFVCEDSDNYPIFRYTTAADFIYFDNEDSYENKTVEDLADRILKECPLLKKLGKGKDEEYLAWYKQVLALVREEKYPYAFNDSGYSIYGEGKIKLTNGEWISYAPPGGIKH